jgi:hypothetical protein
MDAHKEISIQQTSCMLLHAYVVKAHYIVHKMLSQSSFCKILKFVISHMIKYSRLG